MICDAADFVIYTVATNLKAGRGEPPVMRIRRVICAALLLFLTAQVQRAQTTPEGRPKLKDFGSSLKRLKWDKRANKAGEKAPPRNADPAGEDEVVRVTTDLVTCDVQITDPLGNTILGLTRDDFIVSEDGTPQKIDHFSLGNDRSVPRTIVLLIDHSGSQKPYLKKSVEAAKTLVDQLGPRDIMAIVTDDVKLLVDFTRDKAELKKALDVVRDSRGDSKQFSALLATVREVFTPEDVRRIVIFQTDGDELFHLRPSVPPLFSIPPRGIPPETSYLRSFSLRDVYLAVEKSGASVYTVIPSPPLIESQFHTGFKTTTELFGTSNPRNLPLVAYRRWEQIAAAGAAMGGWTAYLPKPEDATDIYRRILEDINTRYVIGYYPTNKTRDGKRRTVSIEVKGHPEYSVWGRKSYIASEENN